MIFPPNFAFDWFHNKMIGLMPVLSSRGHGCSLIASSATINIGGGDIVRTFIINLSNYMFLNVEIQLQL